MLINHASLASLFTGFKATFRNGERLATPAWKDMAMEIPSTTARERYDWLGVAPGMRQWLGDRVIHSLGTHGFQLENLPWEQTIAVERERIEDDQYGIYSQMSQRMGETTALHPDQLLGELINNGRDSGANSYDGVSFFSGSHPRDGALADQDNVDTGGGGPYWVLASLRGALRPWVLQMRKRPEFVSQQSLTDDSVFYRKEFVFGVDARYNAGYGLWEQAYMSNQTLNAANFWAAWQAMRGFTAANGLPLAIVPDSLIIPVSLEQEATELLAPLLTANGGTNVLASKVKVIVSPFITA